MDKQRLIILFALAGWGLTFFFEFASISEAATSHQHTVITPTASQKVEAVLRIINMITAVWVMGIVFVYEWLWPKQWKRNGLRNFARQVLTVSCMVFVMTGGTLLIQFSSESSQNETVIDIWNNAATMLVTTSEGRVALIRSLLTLLLLLFIVVNIGIKVFGVRMKVVSTVLIFGLLSTFLYESYKMYVETGADLLWLGMTTDLLAVAVWLSGILTVLLVRTGNGNAQGERAEMVHLNRCYTNWALSLATLVLLSDLAFIIPQIWSSSWQGIWGNGSGRLLLIKFALVVLLLVSFSIHRHWSDQQTNRQDDKIRIVGWMEFVLAHLVLITSITCSTAMAKEAECDPLYWHVMGTDMHMTAEIEQLVNGNSLLEVTVWVPEQENSKPDVRMILETLSGQHEFQLQPVQVEENGFVFEGYTVHRYEWEAPLQVRDMDWLVGVEVIMPEYVKKFEKDWRACTPIYEQ